MPVKNDDEHLSEIRFNQWGWASRQFPFKCARVIHKEKKLKNIKKKEKNLPFLSVFKV
jgi:hypothetical protein